ncbi:VOC family protein [Actinomadura sp. 9N407]|uniref:VOC family protein n=1 Tax=Actinomadura sp. 9N407 TaxID=3375154 RepID=UPI0037B6A1CB
MPAIAEFIAVNIDCAQPPALATFYSGLTGGEVTYTSDEYASVTLPGGVNVFFQGVADHRPPQWPGADRPQQYHLDFYVEDLDKAEAAACEAGAGVPEFQPGGERWRVLTDPAGHPFCLCLRA